MLNLDCPNCGGLRLNFNLEGWKKDDDKERYAFMCMDCGALFNDEEADKVNVDKQVLME